MGSQAIPIPSQGDPPASISAINLVLDATELRRWIEKNTAEMGAFARYSFPPAVTPQQLETAGSSVSREELATAWKVKGYWNTVALSCAIALGDKLRDAFLEGFHASLLGETPKLDLGHNGLGFRSEGRQYSVELNDKPDVV